MSRRIRYYGDPVLRQKAAPIEEFGTPFLKQLVQEMDELMLKYDGMGLAGPQVGESLRIFITRSPYQTDAGLWELGPLEVFINPTLSLPTEDAWKVDEGCVSIPKLQVPVVRPVGITIDAYDIEGKPFQKTATGMVARLYMHENDHINGVLSIDRTDKKSRQRLENALRQIKLKYHSKA